MTVTQAVSLLRQGAPLDELLEAVGVLAASPAATVDELKLGLQYPGVVAEQAAFALYRRVGLAIPQDRSRLVGALRDALGLPGGEPASEEFPRLPLDPKDTEIDRDHQSEATPSGGPFSAERSAGG